MICFFPSYLGQNIGLSSDNLFFAYLLRLDNKYYYGDKLLERLGKHKELDPVHGTLVKERFVNNNTFFLVEH